MIKYFLKYRIYWPQKLYSTHKILHINIYSGKTYNISLFDNLEYLSIALDLSYGKNIYNIITIKIIMTEKQIQNLKTLKIIESRNAYYTDNIIFETENNKDKRFFEN